MRRPGGGRAPSALLLLAAFGACASPDGQDPSPDEDGVPAIVEGGARGTESLVDIMRGLGADMADAADGLWVDDAGKTAAAARRIAGHAQVPAEERAVIQRELGSDFAAFVTYDQQVHRAALELAERAAGEASASALLEPLVRIQEGCTGCHDAFRSRVQGPLTELRGDAGSSAGGGRDG